MDLNLILNPIDQDTAPFGWARNESRCLSSPPPSPTPVLSRTGSSDYSASERTPSPRTPGSYVFDSRRPPLSIKTQLAELGSLPRILPSLSSRSLSFGSVSSMDHNYYPVTPQSGNSDVFFLQPPLQSPTQSLLLQHMSAQPFIRPNPNQLVAPLEQPTYQQPQAAKPATKKNSYPCPVAKQYECHEFFTTSGHAARHAKKHTGKKDAICPECSKAFTRKDNMEQHRRTHSGTRGILKSANSDDARTKRSKTQQQKKARQQSISQNQAQQGLPGSISQPTLPGMSLPYTPGLGINVGDGQLPFPGVNEVTLLDPRLKESPTSYVMAGQTSFPLQGQHMLPPPPQPMNRPTLRRVSYTDDIHHRLQPAPVMSSYAMAPAPAMMAEPSPSAMSPSLAPALDTLALAASAAGQGTIPQAPIF